LLATLLQLVLLQAWNIDQTSIYHVSLTNIMQANLIDAVGLSRKAHCSPCAI